MKFNLNAKLNELKSNELKMDIFTNIVPAAIVIIGAINWGTYAFGYNLVDALSKFVNSLLKVNLHLDKVIYIIVALAGIMLAIQRTTWVPSLGNFILPPDFVDLHKNTLADTKITITTEPNCKIAYWFTISKLNNLNMVIGQNHYYTNGGVVMSDDKGKAELSIIDNKQYPSGKHLRHDINYRIIRPDELQISDVKTVKI